MLIAFWSATGGSGTSVFTAACALVVAREAHDSSHAGGVRVADLAGDLPAVFGLGAEPELGLADWLAAGPEAPTDALERLIHEVVPGVALLPWGAVESSVDASPEAGAALAVALGQGALPVLADCGTARAPAHRAVVEVADVSVVVLRSCYLSLRRAVRSPALRHTHGVVLLDEPERSLAARDISEVLELPVLGRIAVKPRIARAVDAGVLATRPPESLVRTAADVMRRLGARGLRGEAA